MLLKEKYQLAFITVLTVLLFSCGKDSACFKGTGDIVKEQRVISESVTNIITEDNIDIVITQSNDASLTVEAGANLLPYINTDVSGTVLSISSDNRCGMFRDNTIPITVYLLIPNLTKIDYTGQGVITNTGVLMLESLDIESFGGTGSINLNLNVERFTVGQHSGPADFTFTGTAKDVRVYTLGNGWFYMNDFITKKTHVNHSGIGDVIVNTVDELSVELRSRGNVIYYGSPTVSVSPHIGSGKVRKK